MAFDAKSLYISAKWDDKVVYPKIEKGRAFTFDMNEEIVEKIFDQTFTQGSAILKLVYCNPSDLIFQHFLVKKLTGKNEIGRKKVSFSYVSYRSYTGICKSGW